MSDKQLIEKIHYNRSTSFSYKFAECLLMPEKEVYRVVKLKWPEFQIALHFGVPQEKLHARLESLGLKAVQ